MTRAAAGPADHPFRSVLGVAAATVVLLLFVAGLRSYRDLAVQRARQAALTARITETRERIELLERQIELLHSDPGTLERVARENLGMTRPGDVVVRLDSQETATAEAAPDS